MKGGIKKMAKGSDTSGRQLVPQAHQALDNMKYEIAAELGLPVYQGSEDYWGNLTSRDCGAVGGKMVRRLIQMAEEALANSHTQS
jgi:small acid-soluble spore protein A (major alpha-type SASP)